MGSELGPKGICMHNDDVCEQPVVGTMSMEIKPFNAS